MSNSSPSQRIRRLLIFTVMPVCVLLVTVVAAWLKWQVAEARSAEAATTAAVQVATEGTEALLSYETSTVGEELVAARTLLTGDFRDAFTALTDDVVIPGAREKRISSAVTVTAASSISTTDSHAEVLVFVSQSTAVGDDPATQTASSIKVTLDKVDGRWLIADFTPTQS